MTPVSVHKAAAIGLFRMSVFFVFAVAAFAERDDHTRTLLLVGIFLLDVASWHLCELVNINGHLVYNQTWFNVLADRFIFEKLLGRFRDREYIDFQEIIKEGTKSATADIELFLKEKTMWAEWGWFKRTLAGIGYFLWFWISYGIFYGVAAVLGAFLRTAG